MSASRAGARLVAAALAASGCASYGLHLTPRPLAPQVNELSLNADALVVDRGLGPQVLPNPELGYRRGVSENLDVGGRVNAGSFELNLRWRFLRGAADLALVPGVGFGFVPATNRDAGLLNADAWAAVLGGVRPTARSTLVLGLRSGLSYAFPLTAFSGDATDDELFYLVGGVIGWRFPIGKTRYLFPDFNLLVPYASKAKDWIFPTLQGGVALVFE